VCYLVLKTLDRTTRQIMPKIVAKKEDWIHLGYQLFTEHGKKGVIIDKMAKKLNCNRSSFYWHFKTKKAFINELVNYWVNIETQNIIHAIDKKKSAKEKFITLVTLSFAKNHHLDFVFYLKKYAQSNKKIRMAIRNIDKRRKDYAYSIMIEMGLSPEEAIIKTSILYKYLIGYHETMRYAPQNKNYVAEVLNEISHILPINQ